MEEKTNIPSEETVQKPFKPRIRAIYVAISIGSLKSNE